MPGVFGIITSRPAGQATSELRQMAQTLRHESFYKFGMWADESLGVYAGWTALDGSYADQLPLVDAKGDFKLLFAGEEFTTGGAQELTSSYEADANFPAALNGMFHGLALDRARAKAVLFNDRFGMHRVYWHECEEGFYFACEAKAILAVRPELREIDLRGLGEFITCGCVLENRSLFKGIQVLPPGSSWIFRQGRAVERGSYFAPSEWEQQPPVAEAVYYGELRGRFAVGVSRNFKGAGAIGMSLTGGLDTRAVMAWHKGAPGSLPCYTFGGIYRDCQDVIVARRIAGVCNQPYQVIRVAEDFLASFPRYAERTVYLTDGCAGVWRAPDLYANERVRGIAPVRMTGLYGDEILRYNRTFRPVPPRSNIYTGEVLEQAQRARQTYHSSRECHPLSFSLFRQAPWNQYGSLSLERTQVVMRTPFLDNDFLRTVYRGPAAAFENNDCRLRLIEDGDVRLGRIRTDRGYIRNADLLEKAVRHYQEFTFKAEYAYDYGMPNFLARIDHRLSALHLERLFLGRHKFYHFRVWYRDALASYVRQILLDSRTLARPLFERKRVEQVVNDHTRGRLNHTSEIHQLLTIELVYRQCLRN